MKIKKILFLNFLMLIAMLIINKNYCAIDETIKMEIKEGTTAWTNISTSDAYDESQYLNNESSSLGTNGLQAHLTTMNDWNAMAIFSIGQYGGTKSNNPTSTNNNESGIYNVGSKRTWTSDALDIMSKTNYNESIYNNKDSKYVNLWKKTFNENSFYGVINTTGWLNGYTWWGNFSSTRCQCFYNGLFGTCCYYNGGDSSGGPQNNMTFRPVLWN